MKSSEILQAIKPLLWDGINEDDDDNQFICLTIYAYCIANKLPISNHKSITEHIHKLLGDYFTFEDWLISQGIDIEFNYPKLMETRQLWIDDMIKHFKSIGD